MGGSGDSKYVTSLATGNEHAPTSPTFFTARTSIEERIEHSKCHWSELVESSSSSDKEEMADNMEVFKTLQMHPTWGKFFKTFGYRGARPSSGELVVGEKFAEGGQAELYHAHVMWRNPEMNEQDLENGYEWVVKVFKKGTLLKDLQLQWPKGMFQHQIEKRKRTKLRQPQPIRYYCAVMCGTLLKDGRFAFLMGREHEDLQSLIDRNMLRVGQDCGPFSKELAEGIMYSIALGMDWLHNHNIVHRDLKASNVLFTKDEEDWSFFVADYECSTGVIGTGFFRAPEILQALKDRNIRQRVDVFTKAADVYSYGMTCYEILVGRIPFAGHPLNDYNHVLSGHRPEMPGYVDDWALNLLNRCWQFNPTDRPSFAEILKLLEANSATARKIKQKDEDHILRQKNIPNVTP